MLRLFGKPEGWRPLGIPRHIVEIYIDIYIQEIELAGVDWFNLALDGDIRQAAVNKVMNFGVP
jgi:hypothetical protein